jgi:hypothetical protein
MANVVTITRPEVVSLIEEAAQRLTGGNKTEAIALAVRRLLDQNARAGSLFGAHRGSVRVREGVDLIASALDVELDAETGRELERDG